MIHKRISQAQSGRQWGCRCVGGENTLLQRQLIPSFTQTAATDIWHHLYCQRSEDMWRELYTLNSLCKRLRTRIQRCPLSFWELVFGILRMSYAGVEKRPLVGQEGTKQAWRMALEFVWASLIRSMGHSCSNSLKESSWKPGMMVQAEIPMLTRLRQEDCEFEASLSCLANLFQKKRLKKERKNL